jgi:hypothetical protein
MSLLFGGVLVFYPRVDKFDGSCGRTVSTISSP